MLNVQKAVYIKPQIKKPNITEDLKLNLLEQYSQIALEKYSKMFESKTLKELYTDEFKYCGTKPNTTMIKNKKTGKPTPITIEADIDQMGKASDECYYVRDKNGTRIAKKSFGINKNYDSPRIDIGYMESFNQKKYAGTQIKLTQVEIERAMQEGIDHIPIYSLPEALPFHTMMGFVPNKFEEEVKTYKEVQQQMKSIKKEYPKIPSEFFVPIISKEKGKFYIDKNVTPANAILSYLKNTFEITGQQQYKKKLGSRGVFLHLSKENFEKWKERITSQPILQNK